MSLYRRLVLLSCLSWPLAGFSATALTNLVAEPFAKLEQTLAAPSVCTRWIPAQAQL